VFSKSAGVGPYYALPIALLNGVLLPLATTIPGKTAINIYWRRLVIIIALKRSVKV